MIFRILNIRLTVLMLLLLFAAQVSAQKVGCNKHSVTIKTYQLNSIPVNGIDSALKTTLPFKIQVDSFVNNKKIITQNLANGRESSYISYQYNVAGKLIKEITLVKNTSFRGDSTIYTYTTLGKISTVTKYTLDDPDEVYSARYTYKNSKTYLTDFINNKKAVTTIIWQNKKDHFKRYSKVTSAATANPTFITLLDKHLNPIAEQGCLNNSCTVNIRYQYTYNACGEVIRKLTLLNNGKVINAVTYVIK